MPNSIQPQEYSKGGVTDDILYNIVRNDDGNLNVPYLYDDDSQVVVNWNWLDNNFNDNNPALRFATGFISPPYLGEFCFVSWPFHPPSILPMSSSDADNALYFLLSSVLVSQSTIKSILSASSF